MGRRKNRDRHLLALKALKIARKQRQINLEASGDGDSTYSIPLAAERDTNINDSSSVVFESAAIIDSKVDNSGGNLPKQVLFKVKEDQNEDNFTSYQNARRSGRRVNSSKVKTCSLSVTNLKGKYTMSEKYKKLIFEAIISLPISKGISLKKIQDFLYEKGCNVPYLIQKAIKQLLSTRDIIQEGDKFKLSLEALKAYKDLNDMTQMTKAKFNKEMKENIYNEDNYFLCSFEDCNLIIFVDHIQIHIQEHESINLKKATNEVSVYWKTTKFFFCSECGNKFLNFENTANHLLSHFNEKNTNENKCDTYGCMGQGISTFRIHKCNGFKVPEQNSFETLAEKNKQDERQKLYLCLKCGEAFFYKNLCKEHLNFENILNQKIENNTFECTECDEYFDNEDECIAHIKLCTYEYCKICGETIMGKLNLKEHEEIKHMSEVCKICGEIFMGKAQKLHLKEHEELKHMSLKEEINQDTGELGYSLGKYICDKCDFKCDMKKNLLKHIVRMHTNHQSVLCEICYKLLKNKESLVKHMRTIHPQDPEKLQTFICKTCNKVFKKKYHLKIHMLIHTGEKPFGCKICNYRTTQKYNVVIHMKSHTPHTNLPKVTKKKSLRKRVP